MSKRPTSGTEQCGPHPIGRYFTAIQVFIHRNSLLEEKQSELCRLGIVEVLAVSESRCCWL